MLMRSKELEENILRVLLYFDIFQYPLKAEEIFVFLPQNSMSFEDFRDNLQIFSMNNNSVLRCNDGYYLIEDNLQFKDSRITREKISERHWKIARFITHIIKRFPFVRGLFVT